MIRNENVRDNLRVTSIQDKNDNKLYDCFVTYIEDQNRQ